MDKGKDDDDRERIIIREKMINRTHQLLIVFSLNIPDVDNTRLVSDKELCLVGVKAGTGHR